MTPLMDDGLWHILETPTVALLSHPITTVIACFLLRVAYLLWLHPLSEVPGPKIAVISDLWKAQATFRGHYASSLHALHVKYGNTVRIGPNEVSLVSPDDVMKLYGHKSEYLKGPFYNAFRMTGKTHFSDRDVASHRRGRQRIANAYSMNYLTSLERYLDRCTHLLFGLLDKAADKERTIDLSKLIQMYAYDGVSSIAFGSPVGFLESGEDNDGTIRTMTEATRILTIMGSLTSLSWMWPIKPLGLFVVKLMGDCGPGLFREYASRPVKERQRLRDEDPIAYEEGKDMLYRFMESTDPATSMPLDTGALISNCITINIAGADSTSTSMTAFLRYVYTHPPTLQRIRKEMDDAIKAGNLTFPITYSQACRLEFTWACMKEAMRLHPAAGITLQRVVPAGGRVIGERFYPAGTLIGMPPYDTHLDPRAYGKDAAEWRPERWLEGDRNTLENCSLVARFFLFIKFGQGSRVCLGKSLALMEMSKLLSMIVYHYDIQVQNSKKPYELSEALFILPHHFFCSVKQREW
ncbi:cytochrome P450 [Ramaria rubella]|nr:cytochrome P450 [Ramaria rubella]